MTGRFGMLDQNCFEYHAGAIEQRDADLLLAILWRELNWKQREISLFGRRVAEPRLTAWYGDPSAVYTYSGIQLIPLPWHPSLLDIKSRIEKLTAGTFNSVLANAYRDGSDSMGWHRDDEKELGRCPVIASVSLGEERRFLVRKKGAKSTAVILEHGSLLLMKGESQQRYQHSLPKTRRPVGYRINLTYRMIRGRTDSDPLRQSGE